MYAPTAASPAAKEQPRRLARSQAAAKRAQDRGVAARIVQLRPQDILPVEAGTHRGGGLAIGPPRRALADRRERTPPGRRRGLPAPPEGRRERVVGAAFAPLVRRVEGGLALREGGARDPGGFGGDGRERQGAEQHVPPGGEATTTTRQSSHAPLATPTPHRKAP